MRPRRQTHYYAVDAPSMLGLNDLQNSVLSLNGKIKLDYNAVKELVRRSILNSGIHSEVDPNMFDANNWEFMEGIQNKVDESLWQLGVTAFATYNLNDGTYLTLSDIRYVPPCGLVVAITQTTFD